MQSLLESLRQDFDDRLTSHKQEMVKLLDQKEALILDTLRREMEQQCNAVHDDLVQMVHDKIAEVNKHSQQPFKLTCFKKF